MKPENEGKIKYGVLGPYGELWILIGQKVF
jgi:hypothetical protein